MPRSSTAALARPSAATPRRRRTAVPSGPLGSLTQAEHRDGTAHCAVCGTHQITRLEMRLTDGTPVQFTSCHRCEHRRWEHEGSPLAVETVLQRTRKGA